MKREDFVKVVEEALDSLPYEFRSRIRNVAVLVEDMPPNQSPANLEQRRRLLLGIFHGVPTTRKSVFDLSMGPAHTVLYHDSAARRSCSLCFKEDSWKGKLDTEIPHWERGCLSDEPPR